jgi:Transcription factor WhiB
MSTIRGLPGGGPWAVLADCPAKYHNTLNAARRAAHGGKCVCPGGAAMIERERVYQSGRPARRILIDSPLRAPQYEQNYKTSGAVPDLSKGSCRKPWGRPLLDAAAAVQYRGDATRSAQFMCSRCPVRKRCGEWVAQAEDPAGSWGGIYAGMTPHQRRDAMSRRNNRGTERVA